MFIFYQEAKIRFFYFLHNIFFILKDSPPVLRHATTALQHLHLTLRHSHLTLQACDDGIAPLAPDIAGM
jgi:hypothetical protein